MKLKCLVVLAALLQLTALASAAAELTPFRARNLSPTVLVQGMVTAEPARLVAPQKTSVFLDLDLASNATVNNGPNEQILLDGETLVATLGINRGFAHGLQFGLELPWVSHDGGSFDGFIENWHDFFGLPNGDRDQLPEDQLNYRYQRNGQQLLNLDSSESGVGDLQLKLGWQLAADELRAAALHLSLRLPTGSAERLTGNEAWGASLALALQRQWQFADGAGTAIWGGLGGRWLGDGEVLAPLARNWAANAWLGAGWSPLDWLAFKLQLDGSTPLYDSDLVELGSPALQLTMGGTLVFGEDTALDISVGEDVGVNTAPDVTFQLALVQRF